MRFNLFLNKYKLLSIECLTLWSSRALKCWLVSFGENWNVFQGQLYLIVNTNLAFMTHWKRLWCWEGLGAGGEGDNRGWDGWMASLTRWTWVWVNSGSWWWTGRPGMLRFMGLQRVRHDWATELNTERKYSKNILQTRYIFPKNIEQYILDLQNDHLNKIL